MRITVADTALDAEPGVPVRDIVAFARVHGVDIPDRPWCGPVRLGPDHPVGLSPLVPFARLSSSRGPDARPHVGVHLAVVGGPDAGAVMTVADGLVIGRGTAAGLQIGDPSLSAAHARVAAGRIADLGSRNGTAVRGRRVYARARLRAGDVVECGDTVITLCDPSAPAEKGERPGRPAAGWGIASGGAASLSMVMFALATGHLVLALAALAIPLALAGAAFVRSRGCEPAPALDVTGTLGLAPLPDGDVAVKGPRGLIRAVTLVTGQPSASAPQWEPWMASLPPAGRDVTWLGESEPAPSWVQVEVTADRAEVVVAAHGTTVRGPLPLVTAATADATARRVASRGAEAALPDHVRWAQLPPPTGELAVRLGVSAAGPVWLDLVADGPHILVAGTTGSGKSEALRTIIGSLAHDHSPTHVNFALIDFKGGAGLGPCGRLPHVASVLTDLEPHLARRCLLALTAELADRKRSAAAAGATSFDDWHESRPPRLVVVVDEFQEIASADRDFLPQLARIAAQGRSLGIHLVLATQRPAGAVGAEIRANISTTLALRTASPSESSDLIGTVAAADIPASTPGRAVLMRGGSLEGVQVAVALADPVPRIRVLAQPAAPGRDLIDVARDRHGGAAAPLWLPELPRHIAAAPFREPSSDARAASARGAPRGILLGVADVPERRARVPLEWDPTGGPLIVTGPPRAGKTSALHAVAALAAGSGLTPVWVPHDARLAARTLALASEVPGAMLVLDDAARSLTAAASSDPEALDVLSAAMHELPTLLAVPAAWATHRLTTGAGLRLVFTGLPEHDEAAWEVPRELRRLPALAGRVRAHDAAGWREAHLALPGRFHAQPLALPLPTSVTGELPRSAIGIGGDAAAPVLVPAGSAGVVGPPGAERDAAARRVQLATGAAPAVAESVFALGGPGRPTPRVILVVRPTVRSVREVARDRHHGLVEPRPVPLRCVVVIDGVASAVQVLGA